MSWESDDLVICGSPKDSFPHPRLLKPVKGSYDGWGRDAKEEEYGRGTVGSEESGEGWEVITTSNSQTFFQADHWCTSLSSSSYSKPGALSGAWPLVRLDDLYKPGLYSSAA